MGKRMCLGLATAALVLLPPVSARAGGEADKGQARELGGQAAAAAAAGQWAKAEDLYQRAEELYHAPTLLLGLARARAHLGKYVEAWETYRRILVEPLPPNASAPLRQAVDEANREIGTVEGKRARVTITVRGADHPKVTLDGVAVSAAGLGAERPVNPGSHAVHVEADGFNPADASFTVAEGAATTAEVQLTPAAGASPVSGAGSPSGSPESAPAGGGGTLKMLGIVGMAVGGAGIVAGAVTGIVAIGQHSSLASNACASAAGCAQSDLTSYQSSLSSYKTLGTVSTVSFIAGGVLAAAGAVLFLTAPKKESGAASVWVQPYLALGGAGVAGAF